MESVRNPGNVHQEQRDNYQSFDSHQDYQDSNSDSQRKILDLEQKYLETIQQFNNSSRNEKEKKSTWLEQSEQSSNDNIGMFSQNDKNYITVAERNRLCAEPMMNFSKYSRQLGKENSSPNQSARPRSPLLHRRAVSLHDVKPPASADQAAKSFGTQTADIIATRDLPITQYYDLTQLKRSNLRPNDELIPPPERTNLTEHVIARPFPAEHPFSSHMPRFAIFPKYNENPDHDLKDPPLSPNKITVLSKLKGSAWRHEHQQIESLSLQQNLKWPGEHFYQVPKTATSVKLEQPVYYPIPPKSVVPNVESRKNTDFQINPHTASSLLNVERDQWQTHYNAERSDLGNDINKAFRRSTEMVRPVEGRLARSLTNIDTKIRFNTENEKGPFQTSAENDHFLTNRQDPMQNEQRRSESIPRIFNNQQQQNMNSFYNNSSIGDKKEERIQIKSQPQFDLLSQKMEKKEWQPLMMNMSRNNTDYGSSLNIERVMQEHDLPRYAQITPSFSLSLRNRPRSVHFSEDVMIAQGYGNDSSRSVNDGHYLPDIRTASSYGRDKKDCLEKSVQNKQAASDWLKLDSKNGVITPKSHLLDMQQNFILSEVRRRFHNEFPEEQPDLRENLILGGRKHDFYGLNSQVLRGAKIF